MGSEKPAGILGSAADSSTTADGTFGASATPPTVGWDKVSIELGACFVPVQTSMVGLSFPEQQVLGWLRAHQAEIVGAEQAFGVDRRAIAGAIAWEMLNNVYASVPSMGRWNGTGKVHVNPLVAPRWTPTSWWKSAESLGTLAHGAWKGDTAYGTSAYEVEVRGYLPAQTKDKRNSLLSTPSGAIPYIAAIMRAFSDVSVNAGFPDITDNPVILTNLYQGRTIGDFEENLKAKPKGSGYAGGNTMDIWVGANLAYLEDAVGPPAIQSEPQKPVLP